MSRTDFTTWVDGLLPAVGPAVPDQRISPCRTAAYLDGKRQTVLQVGKIRPLIRLADKNLDVMTELEGEVSCSVEELMNDTGVAKVVITFDNWLMDYITNQTMPVEDLHLIIDFVPTRPNWRTRWGGKVTEIHIKSDERGAHSIEITALSHREHAKRILIAANPIFPPEIQLPRMWVLPGPVRTICAATLAINLGRLFMPGWSTITNIFNPAAWINPLGPDAFLNLNPLSWPIQVAFVNPVLDQSRWSCLGAAWNDAHSAFADILEDAGVMMRAYTYLTTDEDSPNTELEQLLTAGGRFAEALIGEAMPATEQALKKLAAPTRNCVVFSFEDKSGATGPTGTVVDGLLNTVAVTLDQLITPLTVDLRNGEIFDGGQQLNGQTVQEASGIDRTFLLERLTLTAPDPPMVIWRQGEFNGMLTNELTWRKGSVKTVMTGSKSPSIVNAAQTFAIKYGLARLSDVINTWLTGGTGQTQVPMTGGLDALYSNQLDNTLLAWQRVTDPMRALYAGDHAFQEHFEPGGGTAYTLASVLTLREGMWKTRPWASFKATALNGQPWVCFVDYQPGDRVGFEHEGIIYVDNVYGVKWDWTWERPIGVTLKIGEDKMKSDPFGAAFKTMARIYKFVSQVAGEGTLFG